MYRYASDYPDASYAPPKTEGHNNNGYVPYVDYGRDYNPTFGKELGQSLSDLLAAAVIKAGFTTYHLFMEQACRTARHRCTPRIPTQPYQ